MTIIRTPESQFEGLPDYPFAPNYLNIKVNSGGAEHAARMHYVDEAPGQAKGIVLMLHGEPSWSFLYRKMIPIFTAAGYRAIAPDLIGFGKSDKLTDRNDYTYARHVDWLSQWFTMMDLDNVHLICQDWGGLLGLRLVAAFPEKFASVVTANTFLPTGDQPANDAFKQWREFSQQVPEFPTGSIINKGCISELSEEVIAAYDAPFPDESYKEAARQFPTLVPTSTDDPESKANQAAWQKLIQFKKPWLTAFSDQDPITRGGDKAFQKLIPGCRDQPHISIRNAGHFLQEDKGEELANVCLDFYHKNRL